MKKDGIDDKKLHQPLDPDLDYYDATPSIEECLRLIRQLHARTTNLEIAMEAQGSINQNLIAIVREFKTRIETLAEKGHKPNALILPPRLDS